MADGGPVLVLQIENAYRKGTDMIYAYLRWAVEMARNATTQIPWSLCHDLKSCTAVNAGSNQILCTINALWEDTHRPYTQPSPGWLVELRAGNLTQPVLWTEDQVGLDSAQMGPVRNPLV
jgi:hypothetical protein